MDIELDLNHIGWIALEKDNENVEFRTFLKTHDLSSQEIDLIAHRITDEVSAQIDCTECGNCCKQISPTLAQNDISNFASGIKMSVKKFQEIYLILDEDDSSTYLFKQQPCPFLKDNLCINYDNRPADCQSYPHIDKENFVSRLWGVIDNYAICPIVFNVYEHLKIELSFTPSEV
ncbi:MAG: YkgJ family cysteine cluster protein [Chloroflexota bacterium]